MRLPPKKRPGNPVLASDWNTLIDAVAARTPQRGSELELVHSSGGFCYRARKQAPDARRGRFLISYSAEDQQLYVSEGSVFEAQTTWDRQRVTPYVPTINNTSLSTRPPPFIDIAGKSPAVEYNVWCVIEKFHAARIELLEDSATLELSGCENAVLLAAVTFKALDEKLVIESLEQLWASDIGWFPDSISCNSSTGDTSSDSGDNSGGSEGWDSSADSSDDSAGDGSDGSSSSSADCCPAVTITGADCFLANFANGVDTANCFLGEGTPEQVKVIVAVTVTGNPCDCRGAWLKVTAGIKVLGNIYLGFSGQGSYQFDGEMSAYAGQVIPVTACWNTSSVGVTQGDPCIGLTCCDSSSATAPPWCG